MLIDISQEVLSFRVYPGDPAPERERLQCLEHGDACNLTAFSMCAHNGTHVDAPFHFFQDGDTVGEMGLVPFVGPCYVARHAGDVTAQDAHAILARAGDCKRLLLAGDLTVTAGAAAVFADAGLWLLGNESQTVGPETAPRHVHLLLLGARTVLLEGIVLAGVAEGRYFLSAAPLHLGGCDGAPCRAYLMTGEDWHEA